MANFKNPDLAELAMQLKMSPLRQRLRQIAGAERLLDIVQEDKTYPYDLVCYHITNYRPLHLGKKSNLQGDFLLADLVLLVEQLSRAANLPVALLQETYQTQEQLATRLNVSSKTITRWRRRGLSGLWAVCEDGVSRLVFLERSVRRFVARNDELVRKGAAFKQLTDGERCEVIRQAQAMMADQPLKMHEVARRIAATNGRAVETIRYTLRRYDREHPEEAIFTRRKPAPSPRKVAMHGCFKAGESIDAIASAFECARREVESAILELEVAEIKALNFEHVYCEEFDVPQVQREIMDGAYPPAAEGNSAGAANRIPRDLPAYLRTLYETPLLSAEQEHYLFRRYNFLKFKAHELQRRLRPQDAAWEAIRTIRDYAQEVGRIRNQIIQANLRLVVSVAKQHVGWSPRFFEVVSDGNLSLMRAVEKFDYARGHKFSTYASWAIMKNFARTIPEQHYHFARFVTGTDEVLETAADYRSGESSPSDRQELRSAIAAALSELPERDRCVLENHFGLAEGAEPQTLEQIGGKLGVTKERVRQIERRALKLLKGVLNPGLAELIAD